MQKSMIAIVTIFVLSLCQAVDTANGDIVVNVDARLNAPPDVSQSSGELMQFLTAGDYTFTLVNNIVGHPSYHLQANFTGWSFHASGPGTSNGTWGTNYSTAYDDDVFGNDTLSSPPFVGPDRLTGGNSTQSDNALEAFDATTSGLIRQIHIPFDQTVGFYFSDNVLSDNGGGVSIWIQQAASVPEPAALGFLGMVGIGLALRRRRRQC